MVSATGFFDRLLDPLTDAMSPEVAARFLQLSLDPAVQARIDVLADKCNEGELTEDEREEYEMYVHASGLIAVVQVKARAALRAANRNG